MIGKVVAHYHATVKLGAGGMGEVYRATDSRLGREVALKVLRDELTKDADGLARFEREARVLAGLQHSNIAVIHGIEESDGIRALVMELVEGQSLAERIQQGALPMEEVLSVARQVADALEYAHERTIIHRDLKPANVMVTPEGQVKILDFGLAKALGAEPGPSQPDTAQTMTVAQSAQTVKGMIMGTAAYMSPEQARGKSVDRRTDIWAFGCVLYEMLAGRRAFVGDTVTDTLAIVLQGEPDWNGLPASTPAALTQLVRRCLDKDAKRRLQAIGEARVMLEELAQVSATGRYVAPVEAERVGETARAKRPSPVAPRRGRGRRPARGRVGCGPSGRPLHRDVGAHLAEPGPRSRREARGPPPPLHGLRPVSRRPHHRLHGSAVGQGVSLPSQPRPRGGRARRRQRGRAEPVLLTGRPLRGLRRRGGAQEGLRGGRSGDDAGRFRVGRRQPRRIRGRRPLRRVVGRERPHRRRPLPGRPVRGERLRRRAAPAHEGGRRRVRAPPPPRPPGRRDSLHARPHAGGRLRRRGPHAERRRAGPRGVGRRRPLPADWPARVLPRRRSPGGAIRPRRAQAHGHRRARSRGRDARGRAAALPPATAGPRSSHGRARARWPSREAGRSLSPTRARSSSIGAGRRPSWACAPVTTRGRGSLPTAAASP